MTKKEQKFISLSFMLALVFGITQTAGAMHIAEGYLPIGYAVAWGALCIPFLAWGIVSIKKTVLKSRKTILLLAMIGAFVFVLSALKFPSVTGSSSHPTGTGLGAILFGAPPMAIIGTIVLIFQAVLLAHGGLSTLGANAFSMAIVGPFLAWGIFMLCKKLKVNRLVAVFLASSLGDLFSYVSTSFQLGIAHPSAVGGVLASTTEFLGVFAVTQIPIAIIEGILTVIVIIGLESYAKPELIEIGYIKKEVV